MSLYKTLSCINNYLTIKILVSSFKIGEELKNM